MERIPPHLLAANALKNMSQDQLRRIAQHPAFVKLSYDRISDMCVAIGRVLEGEVFVERPKPRGKVHEDEL